MVRAVIDVLQAKSNQDGDSSSVSQCNKITQLTRVSVPYPNLAFSVEEGNRAKTSPRVFGSGAWGRAKCQITNRNSHQLNHPAEIPWP